MKITPLGIDGAWLAEAPVWGDERGFFREWFKREEVLSATGVDFPVQQGNISMSRKGVIRGIHYSLVSQGQAKWLTCVAGAFLDVIVDIRPNSPTFKKIEYINFSAGDGQSILIGSGLGHGFISLEEHSSICYLLSSPYAPEHEFEILPTDKELNISWESNLEKSTKFVFSSKDAGAPTLKSRLENNQLPKY
jgi:dTDP-4-dehydrorhamnose 3,5-epimerase